MSPLWIIRTECNGASPHISLVGVPWRFTSPLHLGSCPQIASGSWRPGRHGLALGMRTSPPALEDAIFPCVSAKMIRIHVWHSEKELHKSNFPQYYFWNVSESLLPSEVLASLMKAFNAQYSRTLQNSIEMENKKNLLFHFYVHPEGLETTRWKNQMLIH